MWRVISCLCLTQSVRQTASGRERWEDSYTLLCLLPAASFFLFLPLFLTCLSARSFQIAVGHVFFCSPTPLPIHQRGISEMSGYFVAVNVVARGPAGGRCSLGTGSVGEVKGPGWWLHLAASSGNVCVIAHYVTEPVFGPTSFLSLSCHSVSSCSQMTCNSPLFTCSQKYNVGAQRSITHSAAALKGLSYSAAVLPKVVSVISRQALSFQYNLLPICPWSSSGASFIWPSCLQTPTSFKP